MNVARRMVLFLAAILSVVGYAPFSTAAINSHYQKAEQLLVITELPGNLEQLSTVAISVQMEEEPQFQKYEEVFTDFVNQYASWQILKDKFITLYVETFTESEIDQLIEFYSSPLGRKSIDLAPLLMNETSLIVQQAFLKNESELNAMIQRYDIEIKQVSGEPLPSSDGM